MPPIDPFFLTPSEPPSPGERTCVQCGYDCRGIPITRPCPECGHVEVGAPLALDPTESSADLSSGKPTGGLACPKCGASTQGLPLGALCRACAQDTPGSSHHAFADECEAVVCDACGYDRRATPAAKPCPECGSLPDGSTASPIPATLPATSSTRVARLMTSTKLPPHIAMSWLFQCGLALALVTTLGLIMVGALSMMGVIPHDGDYQKALTLIAVAGSASVWCLTPSTLDEGFIGWLLARWAARLLMPCWVVGIVFWDPMGPVWQPWVLLLQMLGLLGCNITIFLCSALAVEFELRATARRFASTGWMWMPASLLAWISPFPEGTLVLPDSPVGMIGAIFVLIVVGPWFWLLVRTARSIQDLRQLQSWTRRYERESAVRAQARRERLHQDAESHQR